jgi:hypothetical protein
LPPSSPASAGSRRQGGAEREGRERTTMRSTSLSFVICGHLNDRVIVGAVRCRTRLPPQKHLASAPCYPLPDSRRLMHHTQQQSAVIAPPPSSAPQLRPHPQRRSPPHTSWMSVSKLTPLCASVSSTIARCRLVLKRVRAHRADTPCPRVRVMGACRQTAGSR